MATGLELFISLSILLVGVHESIGRSYQSRPGYDLSNGPVTYEAYYPEDAQGDDQLIVEKSYQRNFEHYPISDPNQLSDNIAPFRLSPPTYVNQYHREQPHTELEEALKMLIDVIRDETIPRGGINEFYVENPSNLMKIDDYGHKYLPMGLENIFKPRPQVINYVFSKEREGESYGDALVNAGDQGILQRDEGKKDDVPQVAAIEVSEKPHKIRHHHGEKLRRNQVAEA